MDALEEAGLILVEMIDRDAEVKRRIMDAYPEISGDMLDVFERIGRRQLYYRLCLLDGPGVKALMRCPFSDQVRYFKEPLALLLAQGKNPDDSLNVQVQFMSPKQARQVFGRNHVRSLAEQRAWIESQKPRLNSAVIDQAYTIKRGGIQFLDGPFVSWKALAQFNAMRPD